MLDKIISGGQTGADRAGLYIGKQLGLETGGFAPYNWMTDEGPNKLILEGYGLIPAPFDPKTYPLRTRLNVVDSHGTLLVGNLNSRGTRLTKFLCIDNDKPFTENPSPENLAEWLRVNEILILNVPGNRERTNPGIFDRTVALLKSVLEDILSFDLQCPGCESRKNFEMSTEEYETLMDDGGPQCIESIYCKEKMQPYSSMH